MCLRMTKTMAVYIAAAVAEIAGCFSFWMWLRESKPVWWLAPGMISLAAFAWLLTLADSVAAGRAYAAYGGIYICASGLALGGRGRPAGSLGRDRGCSLHRRGGRHYSRTAQRVAALLQMATYQLQEGEAMPCHAAPRASQARLLEKRRHDLSTSLKGRADELRFSGLHVHRPVMADAHHLGDTTRVVPVGLHRLS
jgi:hypothetical protein